MRVTNLKKHFVYWALPSLVTSACILIYYFNLFGLEQLIAPKINREFGLVENIQLLLILLIFLVVVKGVRTSKIKIIKYGFIVAGALSIFLFLEEIDYGLNYYDYLGAKAEKTYVNVLNKEIRNIHNNGPLQNIFKLLAYTLILIFFIVFPLLPPGKKEKLALINFLSPSRLITTTAISLILLNQFAVYLYRVYNSPGKSLSGNVSEFEEIMIYYILLLYVNELVKKPETILLSKTHSNKNWEDLMASHHDYNCQNNEGNC